MFSPRPRQRACQDPSTRQGGDALSHKLSGFNRFTGCRHALGPTNLATPKKPQTQFTCSQEKMIKFVIEEVLKFLDGGLYRWHI